MTNELETLPRMIARATALLVAATNSAEIIEASQEAGVIYDVAKAALRFAKLKSAHAEVCATARQMMADALTIEARAQIRLADEYDAAQKRGEVQTVGGDRKSKINIPIENNDPTVADIGITSKQIHFARKVRDAEQREPGVIRKTLDEKLQAGGEPMRADINRIINGDKPKKGSLQPQRRKNESAAATIAAKLILDAGQSYPAVEKETGLTSTVLRSAVAREEGRREPVVTRDMLSLTAQQKFDRAIGQYKAELAASFQQTVAARVKEMLEDTYLPRHRKEQAEAKAIMNRRHGIMTKAVFNAIRRGLHPDSRRSISDEMLGAAFDAFMALEKHLLKEEDSPTTFVDIPASLAEWDKKRAAKRPRSAHAIRRRA
jgi:hypothetical protein